VTVLVAYASRHGATAGIAERIAAGLRAAGLAAEARPVKDVRDVSGYEAFIIGSAAYMFHWLKEATSFAKRHRAVLAERPVWIFSSGPLGTDLVDKDGRDVFESTRPKEFAQLQALLRPRGERVFFGAWDADASAIGIGERFLRLMPKSRAALPVGDFRDWPAIDAWAVEIASEIQSGR
jgi:menaquinone-dependent protoporphyrinogen oxidase